MDRSRFSITSPLCLMSHSALPSMY